MLKVQNQFVELFNLPKLLSFNNIVRSLSSKTDQPPNEVGPYYENRNPRNLTQLRIAPQSRGYGLEKYSKEFWYRISFDDEGRFITGKVFHLDENNTILSASTREWCIRQFLYSSKDVSAAENVGRVLAQRCLECGIEAVGSVYTEVEMNTKPRLSAFLKGAEDTGLCLKEPKRYQLLRHPDETEPQVKPWETWKYSR